ncbi:hypothetical protein P308_24770 [Pseudomonas piscis]|nr:hypothetical protein P308_24770 [Pseudomonas piscis]
MHQGLAGHCLALGVGLPLGPTAHLRRAATLLDHGLLQFQSVPAGHPGGHARAVAGGAQDVFGHGSMMGSIGMQANPAIAGGIVAGDRVPERRRAPALGAQRAGEPERGQAPVDADNRPTASVAVQQFGQRLSGGADAGAGQVTDGEGRGQGALALFVEIGRRQVQGGLNGCQ